MGWMLRPWDEKLILYSKYKILILTIFFVIQYVFLIWLYGYFCFYSVTLRTREASGLESGVGRQSWFLGNIYPSCDGGINIFIFLRNCFCDGGYFLNHFCFCFISWIQSSVSRFWVLFICFVNLFVLSPIT